jgi:phospholipid/cholesterol/gamma-HCH transport system ATP-binding protein
MSSLVSIKNLHFSWLGNKIYDGLDLNFPKGKIVAVMGPSGTGKTTLLRLIGGLIKPSKGKIIFNQNQIINQLKYKELLKVRMQMGLLFQSGALFNDLSVFENVAFPFKEHTKYAMGVIKHLVWQKLQFVGLRGAGDLKSSELSGGMARRVAIARALALEPILMMFDEPFVGQDPITKAILLKLIKTLNEVLGMSVIIVSHDVPECLEIADYVYILSKGKIQGEGTVDEIKKSKDERVLQFINGKEDGPIAFHYPNQPINKGLYD